MKRGRMCAWTLSLQLAITLAALCHPLAALDVGEHCPSLVGISYLGEPAPRTGAHVTLLTLWTPDDPVYRSIMPRLTDLQRRHPEVLVLGVSAADPSRIQHVLDAMAGRVGYANGTLSRLDPFMPPAGLPCSLLIDAQGTVLWWGHPLDAAEPLADALLGTLHVEAAQVAVRPPAQAPGVSVGVQPTDQAEPARSPPPRVELRVVVVERPRQVVVVEPEHCWWAWQAWPVPFVPLYLPCRPVIVAPPLPPPLWRGSPFHR